jgi:hypothetical protein
MGTLRLRSWATTTTADILLFVALEHETQCGALLEVGAALSAGSVYLISRTNGASNIIPMFAGLQRSK